MNESVVTMIIPNNESSPVLLVRPTGDGKSLVRNIAATFFGGVTLTIVPLLALGMGSNPPKVGYGSYI